MNTKTARVWWIALALLGATPACDPDGKKECSWILETEPKLIGKVAQGFIPVCARNRKTMKQDCRFQATANQAERFAGRKIRYNDIKVESPALPRTIVDYKFCD